MPFWLCDKLLLHFRYIFVTSAHFPEVGEEGFQM